MTPIYSLIGFDSKIKDLGCELEKHVELAISCEINKKDLSKTKDYVNNPKISEYNDFLKKIFEEIEKALKLYKEVVDDFDVGKFVEVTKSVGFLNKKFTPDVVGKMEKLNELIDKMQKEFEIGREVHKIDFELHQLNNIMKD